MDCAIGERQRLARPHDFLRLTVEMNPEVALDDLGDHDAGMRMPAGLEARGDLDRSVDDLEVRARYVRPLQDGALDRRGLRLLGTWRAGHGKRGKRSANRDFL